MGSKKRERGSEKSGGDGKERVREDKAGEKEGLK